MTIHQNGTSPSSDWSPMAWLTALRGGEHPLTQVLGERGFSALSKWRRPLVQSAAQRSPSNEEGSQVRKTQKPTVLIRLHHRAAHMTISGAVPRR
jgi:hypothetical protein